MLLCRAGDLDFVAGLVGPYINSAFLYAPDPKCEESVNGCVRGDRYSGVNFGVFEAELVVPVEASGTNSEGKVAKSEASIGESVGLSE